eukprot:TRINITY_DN2558_c0_g1_i2.p1 TRINITY_DN2558_c0_g1~~TRINITY_DN2558_c0_g1_i2.p1  ORF type:complete len:257 (+),score=33.92 TRINITY_DN2558_c0_g1_i2:57-773(+)
MDPQLRRFGPLWIARQHVLPSLAVDAPEDGLAPHLCLRFQTGECRSGTSCPQRHLDPNYMAALRDSLAGTHFSDCCLLHGNIASLRPDFRRLLSHTPVLITVDSEFEVGIPRAHDVIAVTSFWHQYLTDRDPRVPVTFTSVRICRLHQRQACKFGRDCNNVHICREFWAEILNNVQGPGDQRSPPPRLPARPRVPPPALTAQSSLVLPCRTPCSPRPSVCRPLQQVRCPNQPHRCSQI